MLEKLSKEQEDLMIVIRDKWINQLYSLPKINKEQFQKGINWLYTFCNYDNPVIYYCKSPLEAQLLYHTLENNTGINVRDNVWSNVWSNIKNNVGADVKNNVRNNVGANVINNVESNVRANVWDNVGSNVESNVWCNVESNIRHNVRANVKNNVESNVRIDVWGNVGSNVWSNVVSNVGSNVWSNVNSNVRRNIENNVGNIQNYKYQHFCDYGSIDDYGWVSYYDFFTQIGIISNSNFNAYSNLLQSGYYTMIPMEKFVICVENPEHIKLQNNELHCTTDYAIKWQDGTGMNFINGRYLEEDLFFKVLENKFTFEEFQKLDNEDVKAGIITLIKENKGNAGVLDFLGAYLVDEQIINHGNQPIYNLEGKPTIIGYKEYKETQRLYKTKLSFSWANDSKGNRNVPLAWNEMTCPSTGQTYLIETCPSFTNVVDSAKWLRPKFIPIDTPYVWTSAN